MRKIKALIEQLLNGHLSREERKHLQHWIKENPKRNLNRVRKVCWHDVPLHNMMKELFPNFPLRPECQREIEKLTHFFIKLSRSYPSAKWRRRYRQDCY